MEKELKEAADAAFDVTGLTVAQTLIGGKELVTIMRRKTAQMNALCNGCCNAEIVRRQERA